MYINQLGTVSIKAEIIKHAEKIRNLFLTIRRK